ncbi:MAG: FAD-dependent oxidoreductase [Polyangiaceae bacterium]
MDRRKVILALGLLALVIAFFALGLHRSLSFEALRDNRDAISAYRVAHPGVAEALFVAGYVLVTALSLPGAAIMTLGAGAVFGLLWGTVLVSFASTWGACLAFLSSRFVLRDWVRTRFASQLQAIDRGVQREGAYYLFTLRLVPLFPFFLVNLLSGVTSLRLFTFYWVSQVGMLAATIVFVNAGTQLAELTSLSGILSPTLIASFAALGLFPLAAKKTLGWLERRRVYAGFSRPARFDRNLVVIGGGSAGLVSSYIAAVLKAKVTLVEKHRMGGDCLNTGCVPSKALLRSAKLLSHLARAKEFGIRDARAEFDFAEVMDRVGRVVKSVAPHDSVERYTSLGVEVILGTARITSPWSVEVTTPEETRTLTTRAIVIATGARPFVPKIPGLDEVGYLTSDNLWDLRELPARLVVLGGGPIGCELAQAFARFGSQVTQVEMLPRLMPREDPEVSALVQERFVSEGIDVRTATRALRVERDGSEAQLVVEHAGSESRVPFDSILVAVGRAANLSGYGLEELGIAVERTVQTNEFLQTRFPNIYAAGDVAGPYQFTHTAAHQAWYASVNALFDPLKKFRADYSVIPWATFVDPEVARVGLSETEAKEQGVAYEVTRYGIDDLDRALADGEAHGFVKVLTPPGKDRILGVTIVGEHAADILAEFVLAMRHRIGLNELLGTIHIYPTFAEANKFAAGEWKKAHAPQGLLRWVKRFHDWRRGS